MYLVKDAFGNTVPLSAAQKGGELLEHARTFPVYLQSVPLAEAVSLNRKEISRRKNGRA